MLRRAAASPAMTGVSLWWFGAALVPVVLLGWLTLNGALPLIFAPFALFLAIFWLFSFVLAVVSRLRKPKEPRQ